MAHGTQNANAAGAMASGTPLAVVRIRVKAVPNSAETAVAGRLGEAWKIRLNAQPEDGKANKALVEFLAEKLQISRSAVEVATGTASREKTVAITGLSVAEIETRLGG